MVQNYTGLIKCYLKKEVFNLYYSLLPTKFKDFTWIKGAKTKKTKKKQNIWLCILKLV